MCLILFAFQSHPRYRLIMAANRDEFYERPTRALQFWPDHPHIAGGRDLKQSGTWLGITRQGRVAAITNYREIGDNIAQAPSRGQLVADFLEGSMTSGSYLKKLQREGRRYNGFNLIIGDVSGMFYYSNRDESAPRSLSPGIFGLSNRLLNTDWPKVRRGKARLAAILNKDEDLLDRQSLLGLLKNQDVVPDEQLPETGLEQGWERILAPIFITSPTYGTRSSSILTMEHTGEVEFVEVTWQAAKAQPTAINQEQISFKIDGYENSLF